MNALELISKLRAHNVLPKLVNGTLKLSGNTGDLSAEFLSELKENKQLILDFLMEREARNEQIIETIVPQESYPMTNAQQRIWVLSQFEGGNEAYNITDAFFLEGTVNLSLFEKSFQLSIQRHESLRTSFTEENGVPVQKIQETSTFRFETIQLHGANVAQIKERIKQFNTEKFELDKAPLFRVKILTLSDSSYVMLFNMHHIIGDGWSLGVLLQEVMGNYRKLCLNEPIDSQPLPIQFKDYAAWLTTKIAGNYGEQSKRFWSSKQLGSLEALQLPTDFPRSEKTSFSGASHRFPLQSEFYANIENLAKKNQTTVFNAYRSILNIVLHKWTNQGTVAIGTPVAGRSTHQLNEQIGLYVNTLPLVSKYVGSATFAEYVRTISDDSLATFKFQDYPLDLLVEENKVKREAGRNPIFDVLMVVQNTAIGDGSIDKVNQHGFTFNGVHKLYNESITDSNDVAAKFDLSFYFSADSTDENFLEIEYKTDLFRKSSIQSLFKMFSFVSEQILADNSIELKTIEIIDARERTKVIEELNQPIGSHSEESILDIVLSDFSENANLTALVDDKNELTYAQLDWESDQIGAHLEPNETSRVGLFLSRSTKIVSSVLGIWKVGKTYVPIDIKYPVGRIQYIIEDSAVEMLLVDNLSVSLVPDSFKGACINLDTLEKVEKKVLVPSSDKDSVAYLIYTSGSTGQPKGVEITHRNVIAFIKWCQKEFVSTPYDVMFAGTSYCFDLSVFEMLLPLSQGRKIRILDSGVDIPNYLDTEKNVFINTVPSVVRSLLDQHVSWNNVVALNMAGEPVPKIFKDVLDHSNIEIRNLYGPSEDTTYSTMYRFANDNFNYIPIGVPVGDTHAYILDEDLNILPIGVEGEICLSGQSIAKGYLNKSELTAASFINNPFVDGQRMYKTGDIGKWTEDGQLAFTGRKDDQVKVRGFRIELGEIQYQLDCIEEIEQAVAIVKDVNGEKAIIAYYKSKSVITESEISVRLAVHLPTYMIPAYFIQMEKIPMNSNGKVDKKQLPDPDVVAAKEIIAPKTHTQERLVKLWEQALNTTGFGIESNFFELGGHSLKATKLRGLILAEFQKDITLNELFEHPEIPRIAELIETKPVHTERKVVKIAESEDKMVDLSFAQERLWVLTRFENASKAYHMPAAFRISGQLDGEILETAILHVIDRHESLRTLFKEKQGIPYQHIVKTEELSFALEYLNLPANDSLEDFLKNRWSLPFDLENGPLLRCALIEHGNATILSFNMHHIISDGWSIGVLFQDVMKSYAQISRGDSGALSPLDVQYTDFSEWQRNELTGDQLENQLNYWKNEVFKEDIKPLELPYDQLRPELKTYNGTTYTHVFPQALSENVLKQASEQGASLYMSIMANVSVLLKKLGNQSDLVIGTPVSGREMAQLQQQIGFYVNTLPIRIQAKGVKSFHALVSDVREHLLSAFNYQHFPFEMLVEAVQPKRDMSRSPLFDVMVVMQNFDIFEKNHLQLDEEIRFDKVDVSSGNTKYDLTFSFSQQENGIHLELEYNTDLFHESSIERIANQLQHVFEQTSANPSIQIADVSLVSLENQKKLLAKSDFTDVEFDKTQTIISHFNEAVSKHPNRIALKVDERAWTYQELDEKSGQLARVLVDEYQVKDEDLVVLHTERNEWMMISILACLKAGAAYVPVDPAYPVSRIEYILNDSGSELVLADCTIPEDKENLFDDAQWLNVAEVSYQGTPFSKSLRPEQLAYIIYTSGTTGNPKGVLIEHRQVSRLLFNENDYFDFNENDSWTLFHSYCFDFSVWEMYGALLKGGKLVMVPKVVAQDGESFFQFLHDEKITVLNQTPTAFRSLCLINEAKFATTSLDVRYVIFGGEALMPSTLKEWNRTYPGCKLINMYGITETTVHVTYKEIGAAEIEANKSNIGVPIPTLSCFVLDEDLQLCAPGVIGELCVGGAGVARGYHNKPELTAEKFVANTISNVGKLYRSGDFARLLENGDIEYIGRKDEQVKIRGHRIELPEVEEGLKRLPKVDDAVVLAKKNKADEFELIAYYILVEENAEVNLREELSKGLPSYMIPSHYISLKSFPMTSNGKLDKKALPEVSLIGSTSSEYIAPENEIQATIVGIWEEILNKENIGIRDNFFDLGGHSLKATRVISKIQEVYGVKIDLGSLIIDPTVASLSEHVETLTWISEDENVELGGDEILI